VKRIRSGSLSRQFHLANAGIKAGWSWAAAQAGTWSIAEPDKRTAARDEIAAQQAKQWVQEIGQLKGGVVKLGQILATYGDYCLPKPLASALHNLEADTEALDWAVIFSVINETLGSDTTELDISQKALAAASLSQVHRATIKLSKQEICLKVLYPQIQETLASDFKTLKAALVLVAKKQQRNEMTQRLNAIFSILLEEVDPHIESDKICRWRKRLKDDRRFVVPEVYTRYSSPSVLAMSFEEGISQNDIAIENLSQERRNQLAANMLELLLTEILLWGEMQTDPHAGNYRIRLARQAGEIDAIVLLDFGSVRMISDQLLQPLHKMLLAAYADDKELLCAALQEAGFISEDTPNNVQSDFCEVLMGLIEPLNYKRRLEQGWDIPSYALDAKGNYRWADARLPERMGKKALQSAFSKNFSFPGVDFMLVARKLAGVYAFIAALDAKFDGGVVMDKVIANYQSSSLLVSKSAHTGK
jgi:predicted unusual protein kinase regulating ubiquinone biosynthesis (AarF/ABC1/UbiB family)